MSTIKIFTQEMSIYKSADVMVDLKKYKEGKITIDELIKTIDSLEDTVREMKKCALIEKGRKIEQWKTLIS